ncbi:hypothetical protein E4U24_000556 [Claviceps purpurea]|nr:hypothetical protein E4U38_002104 [Claviceps purpurea]KAG6233032.1 hypothetical protein E4U26_003393 [Claviceps purpurea]KAG6252320.1 hypothetical protein E4U24_000556 [Claviceps purpurea]KAG6299251.1 hypothetical protein E4U45_004605 [Claviceps purpurea]
MAFGSLRARLRWSRRPTFTFRELAECLVGIATWTPIIAWVHLYVAELTFIKGSSMYPFLNADKDKTLERDVLLTYKWSPQKDLQRGMVVTLRSPTNPENEVVKRVVALEGDVIKTKHPYPIATVRIPENHVWVEGDGAPGSSLDSNTYGPVSKRLLTGRVTHFVLPLSKLGPVRWWEHKRELGC